MRIAVNAWFADQLNTGSGQYLTHLLAEYGARPTEHRFLLCGHGQQFPLALPGLPAQSFQWQILRTPFDAMPASAHSRHLAKVWFEQVSFPRAGRRWRADLLHVPYWAFPLFSQTPAVVTIHDLIPMLIPAYGGGWPGRLYIRLVTLSARRAAYVLTDSHASRQDIVAYLNIPPHRIETIHLAASTRFQPVNDSRVLTHVRAKYALPPHYFLYLGGLDVRKNVQAILHAYAQLDLDGLPVDIDLVIAGKLPARDTPFTPHPKRIAQELGISERVHLTGWVDEEDKPALYSMARGFLFPSHYEGFGLPPLEAMSCGTPAIVSNRSSLPEVVGGGGLHVNLDDTKALSDAMRRLATDARLYRELRTNALIQATRFSWRKTAQATLAAYQHSRPHVERTHRPDTQKGASH